MEFSRQEFWSGLPFPTPGDLPDSGIKPTYLTSRALAGIFLYHQHSLGSPALCIYTNICICMCVCLFFHIKSTLSAHQLFHLCLLLCFFPLLNHLFKKPEKFVTVTELGRFERAFKRHGVSSILSASAWQEGSRQSAEVSSIPHA